MPCGFFSLCKRKSGESVTLKEVERKFKNGGVENPIGRNDSAEEKILELKNQNESLKRIANQATEDLTVSNLNRKQWRLLVCFLVKRLMSH